MVPISLFEHAVLNAGDDSVVGLDLGIIPGEALDLRFEVALGKLIQSAHDAVQVFFPLAHVREHDDERHHA